MRLRNKLGVTVLLQIAGVAATALTNIVIAHKYGPDGKGFLSFYQSTVDLIANIGIFGFPQAFIYLINAKTIGADWAVKFSTIYGVSFGCLASVIGILIYGPDNLFTSSAVDPLIIGLIVCSATGSLIHYMYRGISLAVKSVYIFNIISIAPAVLLFLLCLFWPWTHYNTLLWGIVITYITAALLAGWLLHENPLPTRQLFDNSLTKVVNSAKYGFWQFIASISFSAVTTFTYQVLRQGGAMEATAGNFSVSLLLILTAIMPLNMIVPVLFDSWSKEIDKREITGPYTNLAHIGSLLSVCGLVIGLVLVKPLTILLFGAEFLPSVVSTQILLLSIYALYQNRLLSALMLALGKPELVAIGAIIKIATVIIPLSLGFLNSLPGAALLWTLGEFLNMTYLMACLTKQVQWPLLQIAGIYPPFLWSTGRMVAQEVGHHLQVRSRL